MAQENHDWGYDRIVGALANLGYQVCDQTVGNVLRGVLRRAAICCTTATASTPVIPSDHCVGSSRTARSKGAAPSFHFRVML